MKVVRLWFSKKRNAKYVSHLDLNRCMIRAVRRARLPIWYTEGFNPHPFITFSLPLSLGHEGLRETMDIKLPEDADYEQVKDRMNAALPRDIQVVDVREAVMKPKEIAFARYEIRIATPNIPTFKNQVDETLSLPEIIVPRRTKSGVKEFDLSGHISQYSSKTDGEFVRLEVVLPAGSVQNINPVVVVDALSKYLDCPLQADIRRVEIYNKEMTCFL